MSLAASLLVGGVAQLGSVAGGSIFSVSVSALEETDAVNFTWDVSDNDEVIITGYEGSDKDVVIPAEIDGKPVCIIDSNAFANRTDIRSVVMQQGIYVIRDYAFSNCLGLKYVGIPEDTEEICNNAFYNCPCLKYVEIPQSVFQIGDCAFGYLDDEGWESRDESFRIYGRRDSTANSYADENDFTFIDNSTVESTFDYWDNDDGSITVNGWWGTEEDVVIPQEIDGKPVTAIGPGAFQNCMDTKRIKVPYGVTTIGEGAFSNCQVLEMVELPVTLTDIEFGAFGNNPQLRSVYIPECVSSIGAKVFAQCSNLENIDVDADNEFYSAENGVLYNNDKTILYCCTSAKSGEFVIPDSVEEIGSFSFYGCSDLTSVQIPENVTSINEAAFACCTNLESVNFPDGLTSIGDNAFDWCSSLQDFELGNNIESIGGQAFASCSSLTRVVIPEGVTFIQNSTFYDCTNLTSVEIPEGVTNIGFAAFRKCRNLKAIELPESLTKIAVSAFYDCTSLEKVSFGDNLTAVENSAFVNCNSLKSVILPESLTFIDTRAFGYKVDLYTDECTKVTGFSISGVPDTAAENYAKENGFTFVDVTAETPLSSFTYQVYNNNYVIINGFVGNEKYVVIPNTIDNKPVIAINNSAFDGENGTNASNCQAIRTVVIPENVTSIGRKAFIGCSSLKNVVLSEGLRTIGDQAFLNCPLTKVHIPVSVSAFGSYCLGYKVVIDPDNPTNWDYGKVEDFTICGISGSEAESFAAENEFIFEKEWRETPAEYFAFQAISETEASIVGYFGPDTDVVIPNAMTGKKVVSIADGAFENSSNLKNVIIREGIEVIGNDAFKGCTSLESVSLPDGMTEIGNSAFSGCTSLQAVETPGSLTTIGHYAFKNCSVLQSAEISDGVTSIGQEAFAGCNQLTTLDIPCSVEFIGQSAFSDCSSLTSINVDEDNESYSSQEGILYDKDKTLLITCPDAKAGELTIPNGVIVIDLYAFKDCTELTSIVMSKSIEDIEYQAFSGCTKLENIKMSEKITGISSNAFELCSSLTEVDIPDSVTSIGSSAFLGCSSMKYVSLGRNVQTIADAAFQDCGNIKFVAIPASVTEIGDNAFGYNYVVSEDDQSGALEKVKDFTIYGASGSAAETYANQNEMTFVNTADETPATSFEYRVGENGVAILGFVGNETNVVIPGIIKGKPVDSISSEAFSVSRTDYAYEHCNPVKRIVIPDGVKTIGEEAFRGCENLENIVIPDSVSGIGEGAFIGCTSLKSIDLPENLSSDIGHFTFWESGIESITLPDGVKSIGDEAFSSCTNLRIVNLPEGLTTIKEEAFLYCPIKRIYIPESVTRIDNHALGYDRRGALIDEETYELLKTEGFTIYGYTGSEAEAYANRNGFSFVPCDGTFTSFAELSSSEITLGKTVDITCDAIGGTAPYEFAFYYKYSTDSNYKTLQGYSSSSKANFKPHEEGTYSIVVKVKDGEGNVLRKEMPLTVKAVLKNNTGISATSIILGESVTITGGATGGAAPYQYSYFYKKSTDSKYTTLKNYSSKKVFEFTPEEAGTYTVVSKVKDSEGTVSRKEFTVYVSDLENNSSISSDSIVLGNSITVKGEGAGGETPYKFSYYYKKTTDKSYKTLKYNTTVSEVSFKPESAGSYYIVVKVIDSKGTVVRKQFTLTVRETLKNNSYISEEEIVLGKTVTITGEATGGTEPYQYAFYYKNTMESSYKTLQAYSSESTATFKPKADGTYSIVVKVKDSDGTVSRKEMTLTVKRALKNDTGISSSSIKLGESVKVTGGAIGGTEPYQYSYFYKKSTDSTYTTLKGYSSKNVVYFKPEEAGTYTFVSKVKDSDGTVSRKEFTIYVSDLTNNSMLSSTSIALGETVTITGEASGGETPYKFAFYYKNSTSSSYKTLKDYSSQSVVSFKPDSTGSYSIVVKVKDNAGTVQRMEFTLVVS